ncbi:MAG: hypothetical protein RL537_337 [Actinomycetota bacterium]
MKNPWLGYTLIRLGMFFGLFFILLLLDFNPYFSAIIAAAISFAVSLVFLDRQRDAMSEQVSKKLSRNSQGRYLDEQGSVEDAILESKEVDQIDPETDQSGKA